VAALALGAEGMNMGTRFVATREAPVHINVKQALVRAGERDTRLIMRTLRNTERVLANSAVQKVLEIEAKGDTKIEDIVPYVSGKRGLAMLENGDTESAAMSAGQVVGLIRDIPSVQDLMDRIIGEAREIMTSRFGAILG
jgi:nitronate monooxygenase